MTSRRILIHLVFSLLIVTSCTVHRAPEGLVTITEKKPLPEFRYGLWVRAASTASPEAIARIVQLVRRMEITDIFVQVVVGGYAYYKSDLLPRSQYLSAVSGKDYDPLDSLISTFRNTQVRIHAWVNTFLYWSLSTPPESLNHVMYEHADWFIHDVNRLSMADYSSDQWKNMRLEGLYLDPENPEVMDFVKEICGEINEKYAVDGIHLDFIRYPGIIWGLPENDEAALLAGIDADAARWCSLVRYARLDFTKRWLIWHAWRLTRNRQWPIQHLVEDIGRRTATRALKGNYQLSAAVFANPSFFRYSFAQDWTQWQANTFLPIIMSYTPDIVLFADYMEFTFKNRPDALFGIGLLWPDMQETAKWQVDTVEKAQGAGVCFFDFASVDSMLDLVAWQHKILRQKIFDVDSTRYAPVIPVFNKPPLSSMVEAGQAFTVWGSDLSFSAFLLSLSLEPARDLERMGLDRSSFLNLIAQDVAAFEYLDRRIFPVGDLLVEPPQRRIRYTLIRWSDGDSLVVIAKADAVSEFDHDIISYPVAADPLIIAAFNAQIHNRETILAPAGIYVFTVDSIYPAGRIMSRDDLPPELIPVFVHWTIKNKAVTILSGLD
jgi:uncharacterized lipoprotein YddW (UPF0748 family)